MYLYKCWRCEGEEGGEYVHLKINACFAAGVGKNVMDKNGRRREGNSSALV